MSAADRLKINAREVARLRILATQSPLAGFKESLVGLKRFQTQRLAKSHQDLLESRRYRLATRFFLDDLYGEKDFSQRDQELARVIPTLARFLPESALGTIADAIELDALSEALDQRMAAHGLSQEGAIWSAARYAQAFQAVGCTFERHQQLVLVQKIGQTLDRLVRNPLLGGLLVTMAGPARLAGVPTMHDFLTRGFMAFQSMAGAKDFLKTIGDREKHLSDELLEGRGLELL